MSLSNNHYDFKTISDLITLDHLKEALTKMKAYTKIKDYTKLNNETALCLSRFSKNETDKNMGIICDTTYKKEYQQVQKAVTSLNDHIKQYDSLKKEESKRKCQIQVIINGDLENFTPEDKLKFKKILAATLDIDSDLVSILEVKEGSIKITIEMPLKSGEQLIDSFEKKDKVLNPLLSNYEVKEIEYYDEALIKELYDKYYPQCENFILKNSGTKEDAKDVFHDAFLSLILRLQSKKLNLEIPIGAFFYTLYKRKWIDKLNRTKKLSSLLDAEYVVEETLENKRIYNRRYEILNECIQKLPEECQQIWKLRFGRMSSKEIAMQLNITVNSVDQRLYNCREKLKKLIEEHPDFKKLAEK